MEHKELTNEQLTFLHGAKEGAIEAIKKAEHAFLNGEIEKFFAESKEKMSKELKCPPNNPLCRVGVLESLKNDLKDEIKAII